MNKPVAVITGGSRGIGKMIANQLLYKNYRVSVVSNDQEELEKSWEGQSEDSVQIFSGDLSDLDFAKSVIEDTFSRWKRIDVLVNNAAWREIETLRNMSVDNWNRTLGICLTAPAFLSKWAARYMEKSQTPGVIVNISSIQSDRASGLSAAYVACKGALLSLTKEMAVLLGPAGIRVVAVSPGNIETKISQDFTTEAGENISNRLVAHYEAHTPLQRSGQADEIANAVVWLCSSEASYITGTNLVIDGGFSSNFSGYKFKKLLFPEEF